MGYIYKIENNINHKVYIGQTIKFYEERFKQHKINYTKEYFSHLALYKAFNKYGVENFTFSPIEEVANEFLDEKEKYSFKDNRECAIFLIEKGYTKSKNIDYISHAIREAIKTGKNYLGFKIYL